MTSTTKIAESTVKPTTGVDPPDIAGIILTGHGNGLYLADEFGNPVRNGIVSSDSRAQPIVDRWINDGSFKEKCQPVTLQSLFAGGPLAILAWISENKNLARSYKLLMDEVWCKKYANQSHIRDMRKCTVGLVGVGNIGSRVAKRLAGFESRVIAYDPYLRPEQVEELGIERVETLEELLAQSDFVSLHMRISEDTHHMINADALALMKPTAYLVNTARTDLVDEEALAGALSDHRIGGAAIDVYADEPLAEDHPYLSLDNITLTSHLAGTSADTMQASVEIGVEELTRYLKGEPLHTLC